MSDSAILFLLSLVGAFPALVLLVVWLSDSPEWGDLAFAMFLVAVSLGCFGVVAGAFYFIGLHSTHSACPVAAVLLDASSIIVGVFIGLALTAKIVLHYKGLYTAEWNRRHELLHDIEDLRRKRSW